MTATTTAAATVQRDRDHDRNDWRDHDRRRDNDWRRTGWRHDGWRNDGWRYYRGHDNRHWRYVPPYRYSLDFGYRSGYELAWRDWLNLWPLRPLLAPELVLRLRRGHTYRSGYDAGWRDAAITTAAAIGPTTGPTTRKAAGSSVSHIYG